MLSACLSDDLAVVPEDSLGWHEEERGAGVLPDLKNCSLVTSGVDLGEFGGFVGWMTFWISA